MEEYKRVWNSLLNQQIPFFNQINQVITESSIKEASLSNPKVCSSIDSFNLFASSHLAYHTCSIESISTTTDGFMDKLRALESFWHIHTDILNLTESPEAVTLITHYHNQKVYSSVLFTKNNIINLPSYLLPVGEATFEQKHCIQVKETLAAFENSNHTCISMPFDYILANMSKSLV